MENSEELQQLDHNQGADLRNSNGAVHNAQSPPKNRSSPRNGGVGASDNPDEIRVKRKTNKGKVEVQDVKKTIDFSKDPTINHITCN